MRQFLIIQLVVCFGWLSSIALAQLDISGAITGSASFPHVGITCLGNLAVFITSFVRKRLDLEMGARDFLATITGTCKFKDEYENEGAVRRLRKRIAARGIEEASVVMLSNSAGMTNSSIRKFMEYIHNAHDVQSVLLKYDFLKDANCNITENNKHSCNCIVIRKELSDSPVLLPSRKCLQNECHGCKRDLLHVENEFRSAVFDALDFKFTTPTQKKPICICVPVNPVGEDKWSKLLVRCLKYKDQGDKGAIVAAADALQSYLDNREKATAEEIKYETVSLIAIRLVEIFVILLLTVFFKVDGFSSSLAARRAVRSYVVDEKGNGLPANVFLTSGLVVVKSDSVCQVLKFRGNTTILLVVGCANLICSVSWVVVLILFNGGVGKWYEVPSMAPSKPRVAVIIAAICIGILMDCFEFSNLFMICFEKPLNKIWQEICDEIEKKKRNMLMILVVIILEIGFAVVVALSLNTGIGRWVYGALQLLVWVKWVIGSYILGAYSPHYVSRSAKPDDDDDGRVILNYSSADWVDQGSLTYSSSFLLNAFMVGVMGDWAGIWTTWK